MEIFNWKTKQWKEEKEPTLEMIKDVVGNVPISIDDKGNIKIKKVLSAAERTSIENL